MILTLADELKNEFKPYSSENECFSRIMSMSGTVYRHQKNRKTSCVEWVGQRYFIKQHFGVGWREIFKNLLQLKLPIISARHEWLAIERLTQLGIHTTPLAGYGCRGNNPARIQSFVITHAIENATSLEALCQTWPNTPPSLTLKRPLIKKVAAIARTLHQHGIQHRDFYLCHFLLKENDLYLIDLHRVKIKKNISSRARVKDLGGLYFSTYGAGLSERDILRFIRHYTQLPLKQALLPNRFWQKIKKRADKLARKPATPDCPSTKTCV